MDIISANDIYFIYSFLDQDHSNHFEIVVADSVWGFSLSVGSAEYEKSQLVILLVAVVDARVFLLQEM